MTSKETNDKPKLDIGLRTSHKDLFRQYGAYMFKKIEKFVISLSDEELQYLILVVSSEIEERQKDGLQQFIS